MLKKSIVPILLGVVGAVILVSLGSWQVSRLAWKEAMLAEIEVRIAQEPVALQEVLVAPETFQAVQAEGRYLKGELHVLSSIKHVGAMYRIIAPFELSTGEKILVDRGWVPTEAKDQERPIGVATITGNYRIPEEVDGFTPPPDTDANIWFARDVDAMAATLNTDPHFIILRSQDPQTDTVTTLPVNTSGIPNDHLQYAITWFSLALVWLGMTGYWLWRIRQRTA